MCVVDCWDWGRVWDRGLRRGWERLGWRLMGFSRCLPLEEVADVFDGFADCAFDRHCLYCV